MGILNKIQVDALFHREAVLIGERDVVPTFRALELFGEDAVKHAKTFDAADYWNFYGTGDFCLDYLTLRGFCAAASFYNVRTLMTSESVKENGKNRM